MRYVRATAEDQARIEEFLSQFVDDQLQDHVSDYLSCEGGGLYLAFDDSEQLAGVLVVAMMKSHEAYLESARLRPDVQERGEEMADFQVQEARRLGAQVARVLVERRNDAAQKIFQEKLGFHVVSEWVVGTLENFPAPEYPDAVAGPAWAVDRERIQSFANQHPEELWAKSGPWQVASLTFDEVWHGVELGGAAVAPQNAAEPVDTLALFHIQNERMHLRYLRSMGKHLKVLLQYLWVESRAWGVKTLEFGLPRNAADKLLEASGLSFEKEWHGVVLEKHLGLTSSMPA